MPDFHPLIHPWNQDVWQNLTLEPERSNHALLFSGDAGLGKQDIGFALAHFVLTDNHSQSENLFNAGSHPDLHVLMPEFEIQDDLLGRFAKRYLEEHSGKKPKKTITVDQVRKLSQALTTHPHIGSYRVVLIFCAHVMNRNAANALLKSLEEPPANTLFIIVSNEASKLAKTIRSRCSMINFKAPDYQSAEAWLSTQPDFPKDQVAVHLAMANNHPIKALQLFHDEYLLTLKQVFTDVNGLWTGRSEVTQVAKQWQGLGSYVCVDILQKLTTDFLRCQLTTQPKTLFFPVQASWLQSTSVKLSKTRLLSVIDELIYAKKMLATTVDELLVLESLTSHFKKLPI